MIKLEHNSGLVGNLPAYGKLCYAGQQGHLRGNPGPLSRFYVLSLPLEDLPNKEAHFFFVLEHTDIAL